LITLTVNGQVLAVVDGTTVAAALMSAGTDSFRRSVTGESRGPLCGMGICFECRVAIDGVTHQRSCNILVREGMKLVSDE
jgi:sarcosine oxidase subunit alpha